jgi:Zn-dependent peptidase ImmA (M78 family)/transcriptional regulator with XRE-family HTH domain
MPRETVRIEPAVLVWARESLGLSESQAAHALKMPVEQLRAWESGAQGLTIGQLRRLAGIYRRPVAALLQPSAPPLPKLPQDFRTVGGQRPSFSPETLLAIRDSQRVQQIASELRGDEPGVFPPARLPEADASDNPQASGSDQRRDIGVTVSDQLSWSNVNQAFNAWRARLQMAGILVLSKPMPRDDCHGFSLYEHGAVPVVVVNSREADQAKIFTLFHEYGHLSHRQSGICLESDQVNIERWCNSFSASFLIPQAALQSMAGPGRVATPDEVQELARRFKVSRHAIALRLLELDLAIPELYELIKQEDWEKGDWERSSRAGEEEYAGRPQESVRLSEVGFGFASLVLSALRSELISPADAVEFLDIRPDRLDRLAERVESAVSRYS